MDTERITFAIVVYLAMSLITLIAQAMRGNTAAVLQGGALLALVASLVGGGDGAAWALIVWLTVVLVSATINSWR